MRVDCICYFKLHNRTESKVGSYTVKLIILTRTSKMRSRNRCAALERSVIDNKCVCGGGREEGRGGVEARGVGMGRSGHGRKGVLN